MTDPRSGGSDRHISDGPGQPEDPLRHRVRTLLGLSQRQWPHVLNLAIVAPYGAFIAAYVALDVPEAIFLVTTLLYSFVAMYVGYRF